jgi:hypothetical protein
MEDGWCVLRNYLTGGGGNVHLMHFILTLSTGHHPSQPIEQLCLLFLGSNFQAEGEPLSQFAF